MRRKFLINDRRRILPKKRLYNDLGQLPFTDFKALQESYSFRKLQIDEAQRHVLELSSSISEKYTYAVPAIYYLTPKSEYLGENSKIGFRFGFCNQ